MNIARFLTEDTIRLDLFPHWEEIEDEDWQKPSLKEVKNAVMSEMASILSASGKVQNVKKLQNELVNVDRRSSSAIGSGIAIPHMRCMQAKTFVMGFARYVPGIEFDAPDCQNVEIFLPMIAPPYADRQYMRLYRNIAKAFLETDVKEKLVTAQEPGEIIRILNEYFR